MTAYKLGQLKTGTAGGMVAIDDTALAVTDTRGPGIPLVYLNGAYTSQSDWRRVIAELGTEWRHSTYDERARSRSKRSADYSFEACIRDVNAVLVTGGLRPIRRSTVGCSVLAWRNEVERRVRVVSGSCQGRCR